MKEPKKIYISEQAAGVSIEYYKDWNTYISVTQLKEWINTQAENRQNDLGTNVTLSQLEKFIDEPLN